LEGSVGTHGGVEGCFWVRFGRGEGCGGVSGAMVALFVGVVGGGVGDFEGGDFGEDVGGGHDPVDGGGPLFGGSD